MKTIYYNGCIYTGEERLQQAFLVEGEIIRKVGTDQDLLKKADENTTLVDLKGRFLCPGFNDSHMHLLNFGQFLNAAQLSGHTDSLAGMLAYLKDYAKAHPPREGRWLLARGWNQDYFTDVHRMPNRADLDAISKEYPIRVTRACGHCCVVNSKALELAGITADSPSSEGGAIGIENGEPDGRLYDNAIELLNPVLPLPDKEEIKDMIRLAAKTLNSYGITSVQSDDYGVFPGIPFETINEAFRELEASGELSVRVYEQANFGTLAGLRRFVEAGNKTGNGNDGFKIGPLKMVADGSLGSHTAYLTEPYEDLPDTRGLLLYSPTELKKMISYAHAYGLQVAVHAIGDGCLDLVLDAVEQALTEHPREDHRHGIVHCQISRGDQLARIQELNMHVYAQSVFLDYDNHIVESRVGKALASTSYSWKTLMNGGVSVSNGSDCPVELPDVMRGIECAVTRTSIDGTGPYLPQEAFTVKEALDSFTIRSAEASFEEARKGRIAPGYLADFTILEKNPFEVDARELHNIGIEACYLGGRCVF